MTRKYPVLFEWSGKNFGGYAPDIPGCMATARTLPEMRTMLKGALEAHLQWMVNDGDEIPCPSESVTVDMEPDVEYPQPRGYYVVVEMLTVSMPKAKTQKSAPIKIRKAVSTKRGALQVA